MDVQEMNELVREPIRSGDHPDWPGGHGRAHLRYMTVKGRKAKKYNPIYYNIRYGFKRWLKNVMKGAPNADTFRVQLYGIDGNDAAMELYSMGVDGSQVEFPECPTCHENVRTRDVGICSDCYDDGLEAFREGLVFASGDAEMFYREGKWSIRRDDANLPYDLGWSAEGKVYRITRLMYRERFQQPERKAA